MYCQMDCCKDVWFDVLEYVGTGLADTCIVTFQAGIACIVHVIMYISDTVPRNNYDNNGPSPSHSYLSLEEMPTPIYELATQ